MNPVVHFEMPAKDKKRMAKFYTKAFGWQTNQLGEEYGHYMVVMTTESNEKGPLKKGVINGGFYEVTKEMEPQHPSFVISVDDIKKHIEIVKKAGGKIIEKPVDMPGVGIFVSFVDTEGNRLSMLQPTSM